MNMNERPLHFNSLPDEFKPMHFSISSLIADRIFYTNQQRPVLPELNGRAAIAMEKTKNKRVWQKLWLHKHINSAFFYYSCCQEEPKAPQYRDNKDKIIKV